MASEINSKLSTDSASKKRVLFIITQSEFGGAQRFLTEFLPRLDKDQYEILVASKIDKKIGFLEFLKDSNIHVRNLAFLKREISPWSDFRAYREMRGLIREFDPSTVFLCSSKAGFLGSLATVFPTKLRVEVIYRIGGWSFNDPLPFYKRWLWIFLEWLSAKWKDVIILNNTFDFYQAGKLGIKPRKQIALIHNGIDPYKIEYLPREEARSKIFEKISKDSGAFQVENIIGTIANFYPTKGLGYLIETAGNVGDDNTKFVIIGDGLERANLEKLIKERRLEKKVFLLGQIPDARSLLTAFDIFVLPSVKEGFPWSLLEAMAAKIPVVATGVGAVTEMIENGKNGFIVSPKNSNELAGTINKVLAMDDHQKQELGIQAHQTVLRKFSLEKMVNETEKLL